MENTKLIFMEDMGLLTSPAKIVDVLEEEGKIVVYLDQTVFYPQGGGQPFDQGYIESDSGKFIVEEVRFADGIVKHIGHFESGYFETGNEVECRVDEPRRSLNRRLHSAGHVADMALYALGNNWPPTKGFHFPEGPYIEYDGSLEGVDTEALKTEVEAKCNELIKKGAATTIRFMDKLEMGAVCHNVPHYIPEGKPSRVVMYGDFGVPCGGTHVDDIADIKSMTIRKIKSKNGKIRVAYDIES